MQQDKRSKRWMVIPIGMMLLLAAALVIAGGNKPYFTPVPPNHIICYQNSTCLYDFNATDDEGDPMNFSIDTPPFSENIDPDNGILNFTPTNDQVGTYNNTWVIVKETATAQGTYEVINWTIININDPPSIINYTPYNLTNLTVKENFWKIFNISADDIDIVHGDVLNYTWLINGIVNTTLLNSTNFSANYTPDFISSGVHNITVNVSDSENASVMINWTINVTNENRVVNQTDIIPNITMQEDTPKYNAFNLSDHFFDPDTDDYPLSYDVLLLTDQNLTIIINETEPNNVSFIPYANYFGIKVIQFRAFDGYNYTLSNNVTINVTGANDDPVVTQLPNQIAYAESLFNVDVQADDPDEDPLTYYDNTTLFDINPSTGYISFTPQISDIGNYSILINVSDSITNVSMIFNITIINNTAPVLGGTPLPDIYTQEGNLTTIHFNATDIDPSDLIYFNYTSTPQNNKFEIITTNNSGEGATSYIQFTPDQSDVSASPFTFTIIANDSKGSTDSDTFTIYVLDIQHYPDLNPHPIPNQRMKVNKTFELTIDSFDLDNDLDSFGENTSLFDITTSGTPTSRNGFISFYPSDAEFGEHWVNITINDTTGRYNWSLTLFNVTFNTPPTLQAIPDQNATEDHIFEYQVNASDPDPQDNLIYYDNSTLFNISNITGLISFMPNISQVDTHTINITVSDGEVNVSTLMNITINSYNDYPYWDPLLEDYYINETEYLNTTYWNLSNILNASSNMTVWNSTIHQNNYTYIRLYGHDEEYGTTEFGPEFTLSFSRNFINFTNVSGHTMTSGIDLFDITNDGAGDIARINFTSNNSQVGTYYVNITVDDTTGRVTTSTTKFEVFNVNDAPIITNYSPNITYYINMTENASMMFNITALDIDYNDSLHYQWVLNGTNISGANQSSYTYVTDFLSSGWRNLTVFVLDKQNMSTQLNWTINVTNINRIGWFGQLKDYNYNHFSQGTADNNLTIMSGDSGVRLKVNGSGYEEYGTFESRILDTGETNVNRDDLVSCKFTTINWTGNTTPPENVTFDTYFKTRSADPAILSSSTCPILTDEYSNTTYTTSNSNIVSDRRRCIQYKFYIGTNDTDHTPSISNVTIGYAIADKTQEQDVNQTWIGLDTYFYEPDTDDNITFNATNGNGTAVSNINITIDPDAPHKVTINTIDSTVGSTTVQFHMFDGYNYTDSNVITLNITEIETFPEVIVVPVGGGGSVSNPVPYEVPQYVTAPVSFKLISPHHVTTYMNDTIEIPLNIFNSNFTLENLRIKATTDNKNVLLKLSKDYIPLLDPNQKEFLMLTIQSYKTYGTYDIVVEATADAISVAEDGTEKKSEFKEKVKIFVNSLLKSEEDETEVNTKLSFAEDLLSTNQECLELNEFIKKARDMISEGRDNEAGILLDQIVESCKYLIAPREKESKLESPTNTYGMPTQSFYMIIAASILTLIVIISLIFVWAHINKKRKDTRRNFE